MRGRRDYKVTAIGEVDEVDKFGEVNEVGKVGEVDELRASEYGRADLHTPSRCFGVYPQVINCTAHTRHTGVVPVE